MKDLNIALEHFKKDLTTTAIAKMLDRPKTEIDRIIRSALNNPEKRKELTDAMKGLGKNKPKRVFRLTEHDHPSVFSSLHDDRSFTERLDGMKPFRD